MPFTFVPQVSWSITKEVKELYKKTKIMLLEIKGGISNEDLYTAYGLGAQTPLKYQYFLKHHFDVF